MSEPLFLRVVHARSAPLDGRVYPLDREPVSIGRSAANTIVIDDVGVSRRHARFEQRADGTWVVDESTHGTFVGGARVSSEARLADGDIVQLGPVALRVSADGSPPIIETVYVPTTTDGLTGAKNRKHLLARAEEEHTAARAADTPLSLVLLGLDRFREIDDTFGHPAGDEVLRAITALARGHVRAEHTLARYSGDELAWLLPATDAAHADALADALRAAIAAHEIRFEGRTIMLTASAGVASLGPETSGAGELVARAVRALRAAKLAGGNCVSRA